MAQMVGAHGEIKTDAEGLAKISGWKATVESHAGATYGVFEPVHYTTQVVAGTNYRVKVRVGDGEFIHVTFFEPLPHTGDAVSVSAHSTGHTADEAF
jgi:hypothetical protein